MWESGLWFHSPARLLVLLTEPARLFTVRDARVGGVKPGARINGAHEADVNVRHAHAAVTHNFPPYDLALVGVR